MPLTAVGFLTVSAHRDLGPFGPADSPEVRYFFCPLSLYAGILWWVIPLPILFLIPGNRKRGALSVLPAMVALPFIVACCASFIDGELDHFLSFAASFSVGLGLLCLSVHQMSDVRPVRRFLQAFVMLLLFGLVSVYAHRPAPPNGSAPEEMWPWYLLVAAAILGSCLLIISNAQHRNLWRFPLPQIVYLAIAAWLVSLHTPPSSIGNQDDWRVGTSIPWLVASLVTVLGLVIASRLYRRFPKLRVAAALLVVMPSLFLAVLLPSALFTSARLAENAFLPCLMLGEGLFVLMVPCLVLWSTSKFYRARLNTAFGLVAGPPDCSTPAE